MVQAGKLDRRVTVSRAVMTQNAFNEDIETWASLTTVWASYTPVSDAERYRAGETLSEIKARFTVRYSSQMATVDPRDRLEFDGRVWDINGTKPIGRNVSIEITATARGNSQ